MRLSLFCTASIALHVSLGLWAPGIDAQSSSALETVPLATSREGLNVWLPGGAAFARSSENSSAGSGRGGTAAPAPEAERGVDLARYYRLSEVTERPQIRQQVEPEFPLAVEPGTTGSVRVRLFIDEKGQVSNVTVERSVPAGVFDQAAIEAFRMATFSPGRIGEKRVKVQLAIEVDFQSRGSR